jgi:hypothetical protein
MELSYKLGSAQGTMNDARTVFLALEYLEAGIMTHYQSVGVGDDDHITLKAGGLTLRIDAQSIAHQLKVPYASRQERLEHDRKTAADKFFGEFDFGDNIVADSNGWERTLGSPAWKRVVFFENQDGGDSIRGEFYVTFKNGSDEIEDGDYSL